MKTKQGRISKVIKQLYKLKKEHPDTEVYIEVPGNMVMCKIGEANIYETMNEQIAIDAE